MANRMLRLLTGRGDPLAEDERRSSSWLDAFTFNGIGYTAGLLAGSSPEQFTDKFTDVISDIHRRHGVVASVVANRAFLMSEVVFVWRDEAQRIIEDRPVDILNRPETGMTRPHMLSWAEQHVSYGGQAYFWRRPDGRVQCCRPDLVNLVVAGHAGGQTPDEVLKTGDLAGYRYFRDGLQRPPVFISPEKMGHWVQEPAPDHRWLGESWVTSVLREIVNDGQATDHISKFFANAATPSAVFTPDVSLGVDELIELHEYLEKTYGGTANAYKQMVVGGGSDVTVLGSRIGELAMGELQGGHETRIMMRGMVHPVIVGSREGMQGASLNAGNYSQIRRQLSDKWFSPATNMLVAAVEHLVRRPDADGNLSHDPSKVMFLQDDRMDEAEIMQAKAAAIRQLVDGGFDPSAAVSAVDSGSLGELVGEHTGLVSVQLLPPGTEAGNGSAEPVAELEANMTIEQLDHMIRQGWTFKRQQVELTRKD